MMAPSYYQARHLSLVSTIGFTIDSKSTEANESFPLALRGFKPGSQTFTFLFLPIFITMYD